MGKNKKIEMLCVTMAAAVMMPQMHVRAAKSRDSRIYSLKSGGRYYGDLDGSGSITTTDLSTLRQALKGSVRLSEDQRKRADLNGDGQITQADLDLMSQFIIGEIDEFPVEKQNAPSQTTKTTYTLAYDANGGSGAPRAQTVAANSEVTVSSTLPKKYYTVSLDANGGSVGEGSIQVGAKFISWNTERDGTGWIYQAGAPFQLDANMTLYAYYGSSQLGNSYSDLPTPYRSGYTFKGWYQGGAKVSASTKISGNTTFTAYWEKNQSVRVVLSSLDIASGPYQTVYTAGEALRTEGLSVNARYSDGTSKKITGYQVSGNTNTPGRQQVQVSYTESGITKKAYFYIQVNSRQAEKKTLTYDANGGNHAPAAQTAEINSTIVVSTAMPEKYYIVSFDVDGGRIETEDIRIKAKFAGWNTSKNGTGKNYLPGAALKLDGDVTLYARYESSCIGELPTPFKDGYTFVGWYGRGSKATANTKIEKDCNFIAHWEKETHKHTPGEWITIAEATVDEYGIEVKKCTECGMIVEENIIPMLANNDSDYGTDQNPGWDDDGTDQNPVWDDDGTNQNPVRGDAVPDSDLSYNDPDHKGTDGITDPDSGKDQSQGDGDSWIPGLDDGMPNDGGNDGLENGNGDNRTDGDGNGDDGNRENDNVEDDYQEDGYAVEWNVSSAVMQKGKSTTAVKVYVTGDDEVARYQSSKPSVVKVSGSGKIYAKKVGRATVLAVTRKGNRATVRVRVQKKPVKTKKLSVDKKKIKLRPGKVFSLGAVAKPVTSSQKIRYMSSDSKVVIVNRSGMIKAKKKGTAVVQVRSGRKAVKVKVFVNG